MSQQLQLDFDRVAREMAVREPIVNRLPVSARARLVLLALAELAERLGQRDGPRSLVDSPRWLIAQTADRSEDTIKRGLRELRESPFLSVVEEPGRPNLFAIHWDRILDQQQPQPAPAGPSQPVRRSDDLRARFRAGGTVRRGQIGVAPPCPSSLPPLLPPLPAPPPPKPSVLSRGDDSAAALHVHEMEHVSKNTSTSEKPGLRPCDVPGWTLKPGLELSALADPQQIELLFALAVESDCLPESETARRQFWGLCHNIRRQAGKLRSPLGFFHSVLKRGQVGLAKQVADDPDGAWARQAIRSFDGGPMIDQGPPVAPAGQQRAASMNPADLFRLQQQRELAKLEQQWKQDRTLAGAGS